MKDFKNGISYYTEATCNLYFPEDETVCYHCHFLGREFSGDSRYYCKRTGELVPNIRTMRGQFCPLKFEEDNA